MTKFLGINPTNTRRKRTTSLSDIVIVMDGSGSVGKCEFDRGKAAMQNVMLSASADPKVDDKFAAVTFSTSAKVNFKFLSPSAAQQSFMKISYPDGGTNTQAGLEMAKTLFQDSSAGGRGSSTKKVLLVTDGKSNIKKHLTEPKANDLKNVNVEIFVIAVGPLPIDGIAEMVRVAGSSSPFMRPEDYLFRVRNYQGLWQVSKLIVQKIGATGKYKITGPYASPC